MNWNQTAFESGCRKFRTAYLDFVDFENPGKRYLQEERSYKDELVDLYNKEVRPALNGQPTSFLKKYIGILTRKLDSFGGPQNLIDWRAWDKFKRLPENHQEDLGKLLQAVLLDKNTLLALTDYGQNSVELLGSQIQPAGIRDFVSLLLMLDRPKEITYLRLKLWQDTSKLLVGEQIVKRGSLIDGEEFERCQGFAVRVREALAQAGFRPRDMIDVQSFLYVLAQDNDATSTADNTSPSTEPDPSPPDPLSLTVIAKRIRARGMRIDDRTLRRYHYAIRTRGFVILAGPSGTGKTWLTKLYADAVGAKYMPVPVAPNWAANEDLLGYFNPIELKFHATPFLEFIDRAAASWDRHGDGASEFHLTLDEMNLARIEHYFSLFLSLMEMRRGDEIPETRLTGGRSIRIPPNLRVVGTVNMDETTHGFADKVFDRAQLIELSINSGAVKEHLGNAPYARDLVNIWEKTAPACPVGFRVLDDIAAYLKAADEDGVDWQEALDEQIVSKILPKLRGIEPAAAEALRAVATLAAERFPLASAKCAAMLRRHEVTDVVSFF